MPEYQSISKQNPKFPDYLDFKVLREVGIQHLQKMSGKLWTDYNLHDPGVTILEVLCYAVTDLGYRNNLDIQNLLAPITNQEEDNFFTADQILTCNPITLLDLRKCLLNISGVRHAWIERFEHYKLVYDELVGKWKLNLNTKSAQDTANQLNSVLQLKGLYTVLLDLEPQPLPNGCGQHRQSVGDILDEVKAVLCRYRNLCEDVHEVVVLDQESIRLQCTIEIDPNSTRNVNELIDKILIKIQDYLMPLTKFYTLQDLLEKGKNLIEIFEGRPSEIHHPCSTNIPPKSISPKSHGFIDTDELKAFNLPRQIYLSDLYKIILDFPEVITVRNFSLSSYIHGQLESQEQRWILDLAPNHRPTLDIENSRISVLRGGISTEVDMSAVKHLYDQYRLLSNLEIYREEAQLDQPIPYGTPYAELAQHYSIHYDFPAIYGIGEDGVAATEPAQRKAQAEQLKGYLVFFDQMLANYLAQLAHVRSLFSWNETSPIETYFAQSLNFPGVEKILEESEQSPNPIINPIIKDRHTQLKRRERFLDHLLARFAESFTDYVLLNYHTDSEHLNDKQQEKVIQNKALFLQKYPCLSHDRSRAINYCLRNNEVWNSDRVSGFEERLAFLLGIKDYRRRNLVPYNVKYEPEQFIIRLELETTDGKIRFLTSRQAYGSYDQAQAILEEVSDCARDISNYRKLTYSRSYHGLEIVDEDGTSLAYYDHSYPTQAACEADVPHLVAQIGTSGITIHTEETTHDFGFTLLVPPSQSASSLPRASSRFLSAQRYNTVESACQDAQIAVKQSKSEKFYKSVSLYLEDIDPDVVVDGKITTYGFAIVNRRQETLVELESSLGIKTAKERDQVIQQLIQSADLNRFWNEASIHRIEPGYVGYVVSRTGNNIFLQGTQRFSSEQEAWIHGRILIRLAETKNSFRRIDLETASKATDSTATNISGYSWVLSSSEQNDTIAIHPSLYPCQLSREESIQELQQTINEEGFYVLEHVLLRPRQNRAAYLSAPNLPPYVDTLPIQRTDSPDDGDQNLDWIDPYSFWISVILPAWPKRFRNKTVRQFVERTLRLEAPAHVALKIAWLDIHQMQQFETDYLDWLEQLALATRCGESPNQTQAIKLMRTLSRLKSVYPTATIASAVDADRSKGTQNLVILNQTPLGSIQERGYE